MFLNNVYDEGYQQAVGVTLYRLMLCLEILSSSQF